MKNYARGFGVFIYGVILSSLIGGISVLFLVLEHLSSEYLWNNVPKVLPYKIGYILVLCVFGSLLIGFGHKKWGNAVPQTAHQALSEFKEFKTVDYHTVFSGLLMAWLILTFGAGVGPEAALLSSVVSLSVWQADKMRYFYFNYPQLRSSTFGVRVKKLAQPTNYLVSYDENRSIDKSARKLKIAFYGLFVVNGLITFIILMRMSGQPSFISKMGISNWQLKELWIMVPLILFGIVYGFLYGYLVKGINKAFSFGTNQPVLKALIGAIAIFCIGMFMPNLLFSGQLSLSLVPFVGVKMSILLLSIVALIKLIYLQICLNTGWIGGDIFPIVFASIIQGFAIAQFFPQIDTLLVVAVVSTSMAISILKSPIVIGIFISLFFPVNLLPITLGTMIIFMIIDKIKKNLKN